MMRSCMFCFELLNFFQMMFALLLGWTSVQSLQSVETKPTKQVMFILSLNLLNGGESYKYLGFFKSEELDCNVNKKLIIEEYLKRLSLIWKSSLSGPCKVRGTNSFCVLVLSCGFGIIPWTKKEVE